MYGCGGSPEAQAPVTRESPEDGILHVSAEWESRWEDRSFRTAPSPISMVVASGTSRIRFERGKPAQETLSFDESFKMSDSRQYVCKSSVKVTLTPHYGDHAGENAVELRRPAVKLARTCTPAGFSEPEHELPATAARFALRADRLIPFAPLSERREYLPAF